METILVVSLGHSHRAHHDFSEWSHEQGHYSTLVFLDDVIFGTAAGPLREPVSSS